MSTTLARSIAEAPRPLLLAFDVDGTLAPIAARPGEARVPYPVVALLRRATRLPEVSVALVTGRDARSLRRVVHVARAWRAVEHGRRILSPGERAGPLVLRPEERLRLAAFRRFAASVAGARVEEKPGAVALHLRELARHDPEAARRALATAHQIARRNGLQAREGRLVLEAEIDPGEKSAALARLARRVGARTIVFAGDDATDDAAIPFAAARGFGLFVRSPERPRAPEGATATLGDVLQVHRLIEELVPLLQAQSRNEKMARASAK